ncbi:MAG: hypothetical protein QXY18_02115 [Nitrososphaerota archaeon]
MVIKKNMIKDFYEKLFNGKISEAESILLNIEKSIKIEDNFEKEYLNALRGIFHVYSNWDEDSFLVRFLKNEKRKRLEIIKIIKEIYKNPINNEKDGFYEAWIDLLKMLPELPTPHRIEKTQTSNVE